MKINITNKQYRELITMLGLANSIIGTLQDMTTLEEYKKKYNKKEELEDYLKQFAKDFDCEDLLEEIDGKHYWKDDAYEDQIMKTIMHYDDYITHSELANKLAWRDFTREHSKSDIEDMQKENDGYFGLEIHEYEKKYWDEFEEHGFDRFEVNENLVLLTE